jgi:uncharacterized repeat protein (TIGR03803 family)
LIIDGPGNLYGTTVMGGSSDAGTIFKIDSSGMLTTLHKFNNTDGNSPRGSLVRDAAGNLYGTTSSGSSAGAGTVFKLDTAGTLTTLHSFTGNPEGASPEAAVIRDGAGNLYGTTPSGGTAYYGTVFKLSPSGILTTLHSFDGSHGRPYGALIRDEAGNLFGTTAPYLGNGGAGSIFKLDPSANFTTLHTFNSFDGSEPRAALIRDANGSLYGTTELGGAHGAGTVFRLDSSGTLSTLYSFGTGTDGGLPHCVLLQDADGNLYGTTSFFQDSIGTVFKLDTLGTLTTLQRFTYAGGVFPWTPLIQDGAGNLYGTTLQGGASPGAGRGTLFKLDSAGTLATLHTFTGADGREPSGLVMDGAGNVYGTTPYGGANELGTVFKLDHSGTFSTLYSFDYLHGAYPYAGVLLDGSGNLYGTAYYGGADGVGTVFKLDVSGTVTTLHSFNNTDGANPLASLTRDSAGNLYGTTSGGGANGYGTVFKLDNWAMLTTLHDFDYFSDGWPHGGLSRDSAGNLYGTTSGGGANGYGTVFKLDQAGVLTTLHSFDEEDGNVHSALTGDAVGNLYGATLGCQTLCTDDIGSIFEIDATGTFTTLHSFNGAGGANPHASLMLGDAGNFYGTTYYGGSGGTGVVFRFNLANEPLAVSAIDPSSGPSTGGRTVSISGAGFLGGSTLAIGGAVAGVTALVDSTRLEATTPPLVPGTLNDVTVTNPGTRPTAEATLFDGFFSDFLDVPATDSFHDFVETIFRHGVTAGCGGGNYCRNGSATRAQMAVFLLKAEHGPAYAPPACTGIFPDVDCTPTPAFAVNWIEQLYNEAVTGGCGGGNYCPGNSVTRAQMAVFLLKSKHGSTYVPPLCTGIFPDVECTPTPAFAVDWIEQLYVEGITGGCAGGNYCPGNAVTRGQMAVFLVKTFGLP